MMKDETFLHYFTKWKTSIENRLGGPYTDSKIKNVHVLANVQTNLYHHLLQDRTYKIPVIE